jgi:peptidoglycan/xylan/chitin deacetylase (PgdA/CDA1 family)
MQYCNTLSVTNTLEKNIKILETPRVQFLYFHHIFKDEVANFEKLVHFLAKDHIFITHSEAVNRITENNIDRPYITWSSDDGIWNNMLAAEVLNRYGASCCFYVNPYSIGLTDNYSIKRFCKEKLDIPPVQFLNWDDLNTLQKQGHEIGNHTYDHSMVSQLSLENFAANFNKAHDELIANCDKIVHFAYTYGKFEHFNKAAYDFVFEQGYDSCTSAVRGCHINGLNELSKNKLFLRRDQIIGNWPLEHIKYFMIQSAAKAHFSNNFLPETYLG